MQPLAVRPGRPVRCLAGKTARRTALSPILLAAWIVCLVCGTDSGLRADEPSNAPAADAPQAAAAPQAADATPAAAAPQAAEATPAADAPQAAAVDYVRDIKPLLQTHCWACHGATKQEGGLRLDTAAALRAGGDSGPALAAGNSAESLILAAVRGDDGWQMPAEGAPLTAEQIYLLAAWIDRGAPAPEDETPDDPYAHWSFRPIERPAVPWSDAAPGDAGTAAGPTPRSPIDAFVAARQHVAGVLPFDPAPPHVLLRRVYLDLVGLPPSLEELDAFLADPSDDAYAQVVDRLLASPQYGERWGRHWMDIWRYSDWAGYGNEVRDSQPHIWRWRDWIVESLNADRGYDQMLREMLAGDELAPDDPDTLRATGYLARNWSRYSRVGWLDATVEHTGKAFLGLTLNCARCHDHRYDPIEQEAYYQFRAIFEPHQVRAHRVSGVSDPEVDAIPRVYDADLDAPTYLFVRGDDRHPQTDRPLAPAVPDWLTGAGLGGEPVALPPSAYYPGLEPEVQAESLAAAEGEIARAEAALSAATAALERAVRRAANLRANEIGAEGALREDFAAVRSDRWKARGGTWQWHDGSVAQLSQEPQSARLVLVESMPADFSARLKLSIRGGEKWRSAGLVFDLADEQHYSGVYLSAHQGGAKVQVWQRHAGSDVYPPAGAKPLPIALAQSYELRVDVQGPLVNVAVDGVPVIAFRLPHQRGTGPLALMTYDAQATFDSINIDPLPADAQLAAELADPPAPLVAMTVDEARSMLLAAEEGLAAAGDQLALARAKHNFAVARIAADRAIYAPPAADAVRATESERPPDTAENLALAAWRAEQQIAVIEIDTRRRAAQRRTQQLGAECPPAELQAAQAELATVEAEWQAAVARRDESRRDYSPLGPVYPDTSTGRRLALARWITDARHPLTARVAVNHIWMRHFGQPLVSTVFDFGRNGQRPTHPKLLDWLAAELVEHHWSMKHLHRAIVLSDAYRRASQAAAGSHDEVVARANRTVDPDNQLLWRMNPRRMEAEVVRDSVLALSGRLDLELGGPDIDYALGQKVARRSLYFRTAREKQMTFLKVFDAASVGECYRRAESIVPQQALALANSPLVISESRRLAIALLDDVAGHVAAPELAAQAATLDEGLAAQGESPADAGSARARSSGSAAAPREFVRRAFVVILARPPSAAEAERALVFLTAQSERLAASEQLAPHETGPETEQPAGADPWRRACENLVHVLLNHHDFVTVH